MPMTLKALRVNADMNQREAAKIIGITPETLGKWENGKTFPDVRFIQKIEQLYNVKYEDIKFIVKEGETE